MSGISAERGKLLATGIVIAGCLCSFAGFAQVKRTPYLYDNCPQTLRMSVSERQAAVNALVARVRGEVAKLSSNASAQDIEAAIAFAFSQANAPADIAVMAIAALESDASLSNNVRRALGNARLALDTCGGGVGTAAINGGANNFGDAFLSSPVLGVGGGGSSNYTS